MMKPTVLKKSNIVNAVHDFLMLGITIIIVYWLFAPDNTPLLHPVSLADLKGVWTTDSPRYRDRFLQFADGTITFGWGEAGAGTYAIGEIDSEPAENSTLVHIRYVDLTAADYKLSFYYVDQNGGMVWMKTQKGVYWNRTSTEPTYKAAFK